MEKKPNAKKQNHAPKTMCSPGQVKGQGAHENRSLRYQAKAKRMIMAMFNKSEVT